VQEESTEAQEGAQQSSDRREKRDLDHWFSRPGSSRMSAQEGRICTIRLDRDTCHPLDMQRFERGLTLSTEKRV
jgi:hypothetical protein